MKTKGLFILLITSIIMMSATIDLNQLYNYSNQVVPNYILKNNIPANNNLTDAGATLGRVMFYDKNLSINNTISCASCHKQEFAFGDTAVRSVGYNGGLTDRHSMRLVNARFGTEIRFFWDERATSLENQTTQPIKDHVEMGFSGTAGNVGFDSLIRKLQSLSYYNELFQAAYGSDEITEQNIQKAIAQFIRSIQSFDSKYDIGRVQVQNDGQPFPNFSQQENMGKMIFINPPNQGGAGCQGCHRAPEFDIDPVSRNNGIVGVLVDTSAIDLLITRSPSLRNLVNPSGQINGPFMHTGQFTDIEQVIEHYNLIPNNPANTNLDPRLRGPGGVSQNLQLTTNQKLALAAFLRTLTGNAVYTDERWSNPFDSLGNITIIPKQTTGLKQYSTSMYFQIFPNPAHHSIQVVAQFEDYQVDVFSLEGKKVFSGMNTIMIPILDWQNGIYQIQLTHNYKIVETRKFIKL